MIGTPDDAIGVGEDEVSDGVPSRRDFADHPARCGEVEVEVWELGEEVVDVVGIFGPASEMGAEPGPVTVLLEEVVPLLIVGGAGAECGVGGVFALIPDLGVSDVRHDDHVASADLREDAGDVGRIDGEPGAMERAGGEMELGHFRAEVMKGVQPADPVVEPVGGGELLPVGNGDKVNAMAVTSKKRDGFLEGRLGDDLVETEVVGGCEEEVGVTRRDEVDVSVDGGSANGRPRPGREVINAGLVVVGKGRGGTVHGRVEV